jgi:hypothetical protein
MSVSGPSMVPAKREAATAPSVPHMPDTHHVARHYKAIGIPAIASAVSIFQNAKTKRPAKTEWPAFLRSDSFAA